MQSLKQIKSIIKSNPPAYKKLVDEIFDSIMQGNSSEQIKTMLVNGGIQGKTLNNFSLIIDYVESFVNEQN